MAYFRASGENFDVDAFLASTKLVPDHVFRRGTPKPTRASSPQKTWAESGFGIGLGEAFGRLPPQISEASAFFEAHGAELRSLAQYPGVTDVRLIFSYCPGTSANVSEYLPPSLLSEVAQIGAGIDLDVYPGDDSWIENDTD